MNVNEYLKISRKHQGEISTIFESLNLPIEKAQLDDGEISKARAALDGEKILYRLILSSSKEIYKNHIVLKYNNDTNHFEVLALHPVHAGRRYISIRNGFVPLQNNSPIFFPSLNHQEKTGSLFYFTLPFQSSKTSQVEPVQIDEDFKRQPDWKLSNEWQNVEREALKKYLLSYGYGRWQKFRDVSAVSGNYLLKKSDKEMQIFSNSLIRAILEFIPPEKLEVKYQIVKMMKEKTSDPFVSIKSKQWGMQIKARAPAWAKRLILLFRIDALMICYNKKRQLFNQSLKMDRTKTLDQKEQLKKVCENYENLLAFLPNANFYGQRPAAWWSKRHDVDLIVGTYRHGYANYNQMRKDKLLTLKSNTPDSKSYHQFPNADTITRRLKKLVSMIGKSMPDFKELDLSVVPQPNFQQPTGFTLEEKQAIVKVLMLYGIPVTVDGKCDYQDLKVRANEMLETPIDQSKNMTMIERFVHRLRMLAIEFDRIKNSKRPEQKLSRRLKRLGDDDEDYVSQSQFKRKQKIQVIELSDDQDEQEYQISPRKKMSERRSIKRFPASFYSGQQDDQDDEDQKIMQPKLLNSQEEFDNVQELSRGLSSLDQSKKIFDPDNDGFALNEKQIHALNTNIPMLHFIRRKILTQNCKLFNSKIKQIDTQFKNGTDYCRKFKITWNKILHQQWQPAVHDLILLQAIAKHGMNFCEEFDSILLAQHNFDDQILLLLDSDLVKMRVEYVFEKIKIASQAITNQSTNNSISLVGISSTPASSTRRHTASQQASTSSHRKDRNLGSGFIPPRKPKKEFKVNRDQIGNITYPIIVNASLKIENLGIIDYERKAYHSERNLFPIGFRSVREHQSILEKGQRADYLCEIQDGGDKPQFKITPSQDPSNPIVKESSTGCWINILNGSNRASVTISGPQRFGIADFNVIKLLQELPNAKRCKRYQLK